jgi:hypothetical protein
MNHISKDFTFHQSNLWQIHKKIGRQLVIGYSKIFLVAHDWGDQLHILMQLHIPKIYKK